MADGFNFDVKDVLKRQLFIQEKIKNSCIKYAKTGGEKLVEYAKQNAKWKDDSGNSRQSIDYSVTYNNGDIALNLQGHTPQFKYLEYAMEKKYAILHPTVDKFTNEILKGWAESIRGL